MFLYETSRANAVAHSMVWYNSFHFIHWASTEATIHQLTAVTIQPVSIPLMARQLRLYFSALQILQSWGKGVKKISKNKGIIYAAEKMSDKTIMIDR